MPTDYRNDKRFYDESASVSSDRGVTESLQQSREIRRIRCYLRVED